MSNALILFTRVPLPGKTKTRLMPFLSGDECAKLHSCFIQDIYKKSKTAGADVFIFFTPEDQKGILRDLLDDSVPYYPQEGSDLGEKMKRAIGTVLEKGYEKVLLMGTDIPQVEVHVLKEAFQDLTQNDIVIHPTFDGGYYLIGMKKEYNSIWKVERYGTNTVIQDTLAHMEKENLSVAVGAKYYDIDDKEDLKSLYEDIKGGVICTCPNTERYLCQELKERLEKCDE